MTSFLERMRLWNDRMNGLPRKGLLVTVTLLLTCFFVVLVPLCWPFLLAVLFSMALEPLVSLCVKHVKRVRLPRGLLTLLGMALLFGVLGVATFTLLNRLLREMVALAHATPTFVRWLGGTVVPYVKNLYQQYSDVLPATVMNVVNNGLSALGDSAIKMAGTLSATLTSGAVNAAASIPGMLLSVVLTIMGTYYMTVDRERILTFFRRTFPQNMQQRGLQLKNNLLRSLFGQVKSQLLVSLIITTFLVLSLVIYGVKYGLLMGVLIGIMDALPVLGAGLFLIPWGLVELVLGNYTLAIFLGCVYIGTIVIRQICEPRIVGANLGLYPLTTMIAMFAGYKLFGFLGLLAGPILLNLLKVVLEADDVAHGIKPEGLRPRSSGRNAQRRTVTAGKGADQDAGTPGNAEPDADTVLKSDLSTAACLTKATRDM